MPESASHTAAVLRQARPGTDNDRSALWVLRGGVLRSTETPPRSVGDQFPSRGGRCGRRADAPRTHGTRHRPPAGRRPPAPLLVTGLRQAGRGSAAAGPTPVLGRPPTNEGSPGGGQERRRSDEDAQPNVAVAA